MLLKNCSLPRPRPAPNLDGILSGETPARRLPAHLVIRAVDTSGNVSQTETRVIDTMDC